MSGTAGTGGAGGSGAASSSANLGGVFDNSADAIIGSLEVVQWVVYFIAIYYAFTGISKLRQSGINPQQMPMNHGVRSLVISGALLSITFVARAFVEMLVGGDIVGSTRIDSPSLSAAGASEGLDGMLVHAMTVIDGPLRGLLSVICYFIGLIFFISFLMRLTGTGQEGVKSPTGKGTWTTLMVAAIMMSMGHIMDAFTGTLFPGGGSYTMSLAYSNEFPDNGQSAQLVLNAIIVFVQIIGWIAFIRGFLMMKGMQDGTSQGTMSACFTHIIGGVCAVNMPIFITVMEKTLGITMTG